MVVMNVNINILYLPGFVLKTKEQKKLERLAAENEPKITLENSLNWKEVNWIKVNSHQSQLNLLPNGNKNKLPKRSLKEKRMKKEVEEYLQVEKLFWRSCSDKYYTEEDNGETWDLSQFKSNLPDDSDPNIKDYGDGSKAQEYYQQEDNQSESLENKDAITA